MPALPCFGIVEHPGITRIEAVACPGLHASGSAQLRLPHILEPVQCSGFMAGTSALERGLSAGALVGAGCESMPHGAHSALVTAAPMLRSDGCGLVHCFQHQSTEHRLQRYVSFLL
eukprot:jgi/Ulvmu1/4056/UM019_0033.1